MTYAIIIPIPCRWRVAVSLYVAPRRPSRGSKLGIPSVGAGDGPRREIVEGTPAQGRGASNAYLGSGLFVVSIALKSMSIISLTAVAVSVR